MAKKQLPELIDATQSEPIVEKPVEVVDKVFATQVELGTGAHLLGLATTMAAVRGSTLEVTELGINATSAKGRVMLIPWSNIRCVELKPITKFSKRAA